jgi:hypothetical protein
MAYPEGCPYTPRILLDVRPSLGACATVLKWFFNEDLAIPSPVVASSDVLKLSSYTGPALTVGGELNKLASNACIPRDTAGVQPAESQLFRLGIH